MLIEVTGDKNNLPVRIIVGGNEYTYTSLTAEDKHTVDTFTNFLITNLQLYKFLGINYRDDVEINIEYLGTSLTNSDYELIDFDNLSDDDKSILDNIINL